MSEIVFGRIIDAGQVEEAVEGALRERLSVVLAAAEEQWGLEPGTIKRPARWIRTVDPGALGEANMPLVAIENVGALAEPEVDGDGQISIRFGINVAVFAKGRNRPEALTTARRICAAVRATLIGRSSLGEFADAVWLIDEGYGDYIDARRERTITDAQVVFGVLVSNVATRGAGPEVVPDFPPTVPDWPVFEDPPEAETVTVTINPIEEA
jgi:hypothetical protein